jgi:hypothetical protein
MQTKANPEIVKYLFKAGLRFPTCAINQNPITNVRPPRGLLKVVTVVREARKNSTGSPEIDFSTQRKCRLFSRVN